MRFYSYTIYIAKISVCVNVIEPFCHKDLSMAGAATKVHIIENKYRNFAIKSTTYS